MIGRVIRPHGLDGSLRIQPYSDNPNRFRSGRTLEVAGVSATVDSYQPVAGGHALLKLTEVEDSREARKFAGEWIFAAIDAEDALPPGEFYHYQLVGLSVVTDQGERLGTIQEILATGSNDVYVVSGDAGDELLLPAISQVVQQIDLEARTVRVHLIDGLR